MTNNVVRLDRLGRNHLARVGGKAANLGELHRIAGVRVPPGFCVATGAFTQHLAADRSIDELLDQLAHLSLGDRARIAAVSADIRAAIEMLPVADNLAREIAEAIAPAGGRSAWAVRSSATAEDLPTASFAGQHESYLNAVGADAVVAMVARCWASLFSERAVTYRIRKGIDHRSVGMAVIVQRMLSADASGVAFTADPTTSNRTVVAVEAVFGLAEALVSGEVDPDAYTVRNGQLTSTRIATKRTATFAAPGGGTEQRNIDVERQHEPVLTEGQVVELARLARRIEAHFDCPQDIEWCLVDDDFEIVQSRPITTLFPIPARDDDQHHVYISVGHQQMMTDPMKPLGLSMWLLTTPAPMHTAACRLFVDVTAALAAPASRAALVSAAGRSDPLIGDALQTIVDRSDFLPPNPGDSNTSPAAASVPPLLDADSTIVTELIAAARASLEALRRHIQARSGPELFDVILDDLPELKRLMFAPRSRAVITAAMEATWWINDHLHAWLDETDAADTLAQAVENNVTAEMGLALLDVADAIRPHPDVVAFLRNVGDDDKDFLDRLTGLDGGAEARAVIDAYLDAYGMRCVGEIDITRPRWAEHPQALVPLIVGNVQRFEPGERARRFESGLRNALAARAELLDRVRVLPDGQTKADELAAMIDRVRAFNGYREFPKYAMVSRYAIYKHAILTEATRLVESGVLRDADDAFFLTFHELHDAARTGHADHQLVDKRRDEFRAAHELTPPRVLTSDGEALDGSYRREDTPDGALVGLPVSAGTIEGRARIIHDIDAADLEPGDILVTTHTDPSWSPLFVAIAGLVTEVGGLMTHGAVIAREYGIPAIVGVRHATQRITDGQLIRVHGTQGYIEHLPEPRTS